MEPLKVADLFCGVGGLSQGFIWAGCEVSIGIEYNKEIANSYKLNHPFTDVYADDIRNVNFKELHVKHPRIDVVVGGPPCQGFSQKGKRLSLNDDRNFLFQSFVQFVDEFRPKYFVLENVPEIITTSGGFFKDEIVQSFKLIGYDITYGVLRAVDFGVPQDRRRAIFIGQLNSLEVTLPEATGESNTVKDAIYDLPFIASGEGKDVSSYDKEPESKLQCFLRKGASVLYNHVATSHSDVALERLSLIPKGAGREALPPEHRTRSIYSGTWSRLLEDGVASTITTRFDTPSSGRFTHPILDRCLTVREAARIQTFPDTFRFYGSKTCQMKQVGNAVPPYLSYAIAKVIINNELKDSL
ncbi:MAG: DNA cytosine methyltransferase [Bacteroidales bacterium]|nr:DNA cytosine methyltransferase [Bacteroidales bacterium]